MLKLKLQYFGLLMWRTDSLEKTLMLGKIEGRRRARQRRRWLDNITDSMDMSLSKFRSWWWMGKPGVLQSMGLQRVRHDWVTELNWTYSQMWWKNINLYIKADQLSQAAKIQREAKQVISSAKFWKPKEWKRHKSNQRKCLHLGKNLMIEFYHK